MASPAGNTGGSKPQPQTQTSDQQRPTLTASQLSSHGRGGAGNMAKNDDPYETRLRQDVEGYAPGPLSLPYSRYIGVLVGTTMP